MKNRGCLNQTLFFIFTVAAFGFSSYFWFTFFVRGRSVETPNLIGKSLTDARAISSDLGLVLLVDSDRDRNANNVAKEAVVWQNRAPGSLVKRGTRLHIGRSLGPLILSVPDLSGQSPRTALLRFAQRNLRLGNLAYIDVSKGRGIIAADPPHGTVVPGQTAVSLLVGYEPDPPRFVMPDVINRLITDVRPSLESRGLTVPNVKYESYPGIAEGTVIRQYPLPGHSVSAKDAVSLVVCKNEVVPLTPPPPS